MQKIRRGCTTPTEQEWQMDIENVRTRIPETRQQQCKATAPHYSSEWSKIVTELTGIKARKYHTLIIKCTWQLINEWTL